jgi:hypothetical protein
MELSECGAASLSEAVKVAIQVKRALWQLHMAFETADDQVTGILSS